MNIWIRFILIFLNYYLMAANGVNAVKHEGIVKIIYGITAVLWLIAGSINLFLLLR